MYCCFEAQECQTAWFSCGTTPLPEKTHAWYSAAAFQKYSEITCDMCSSALLCNQNMQKSVVVSSRQYLALHIFTKQRCIFYVVKIWCAPKQTQLGACGRESIAPTSHFAKAVPVIDRLKDGTFPFLWYFLAKLLKSLFGSLHIRGVADKWQLYYYISAVQVCTILCWERGSALRPIHVCWSKIIHLEIVFVLEMKFYFL